MREGGMPGLDNGDQRAGRHQEMGQRRYLRNNTSILTTSDSLKQAKIFAHMAANTTVVCINQALI